MLELHRFRTTVGIICFVTYLPVGRDFPTAEIASAADDTRGAKALFEDAASGAVITATSPRPKPAGRQSTVSTARDPAPSTSVSASYANSGLMYYIELIKPGGETLRVTSNRVFHSGERIRLHVESNTPGRVVLTQHQADGTARILFPDPRVRGGDNWIDAKVDSVLPSADDTAWFRFDDKPGKERLTLLLMPISREAPLRRAATSLADRGREDCANAINMAGAKDLNIEMANTLARCAERAAGSKDLVLETDETSKQPASYVVSRRIPRADEPVLVSTEIVLHHEP